MGKRELVALLILSPWCLVIAVLLFLTVPWVCLQFVIVVFPDHNHFLFLLIYHQVSKIRKLHLFKMSIYKPFALPLVMPQPGL